MDGLRLAARLVLLALAGAICVIAGSAVLAAGPSTSFVTSGATTTFATHHYDWASQHAMRHEGAEPAAAQPVTSHAVVGLLTLETTTSTAAEAGTAVKPSFIASADGVVVPTSRSRLVQGFEDAGLPSVPTRSPGTQYTLPDGSLVRVMEPSGQAPLRASFTDSLGNAINPFTGKQPQPPPGATGAAWRQLMRDLTHVELGP